jgi:hypothetical protein
MAIGSGGEIQTNPRSDVAHFRSWILAVAAGEAVYHGVIRRRHLAWGATTMEAGASMAGDELVRNPIVITTRAVPIRARPDDVWPWLAQLGAGRGGLYSYDWLDRLFGILDGPSSEVVLQEFQHIQSGDVIPLGAGPDWTVDRADAGRALVLSPVPGQVSWAFELHQAAAETRLVSRVRMRVYSMPVVWLAAPLIDSVWFMMERKMLLGIKERAERLARERLLPI